MSRQISLPDTDIRTRSRSDELSVERADEPGAPLDTEDRDEGRLAPPAAGGRRPTLVRVRPEQDDHRPSGRVRHDEKITVYVSSDELFELEQARLVLRGQHGLAVDRGRIVREAVAVLLADLDTQGEASILVRRLRGD